LCTNCGGQNFFEENHRNNGKESALDQGEGQTNRDGRDLAGLGLAAEWSDGRRGPQGLVEDLQIVDTVAAKVEAQPQPEEKFERTAPIVGEQTKLIF
jgi:hypothetical protein